MVDLINPAYVQAVRDAIAKLTPLAIKNAQEAQPDQGKSGIFYVQYLQTLNGLLKTNLPPQLADTPLPTLIAEDVFVDVYILDAFFSNSDFTLFTIFEMEGFKKWSQWREQNFSLYDFDETTRELKPNKDTPVLNFEEVKKLLLSKDVTPEQGAEFDEKLKNGALFLDGASKIEKVAFSSFLRSGNTLTRKYLEEITGIVSGSIMHNKRVGNYTLFMPYFKAEGHYGDDQWVYKSHLPFTSNFTKTDEVFPQTKSIFCVRNPFDVAPSLLQLRLTQTHTLSTEQSLLTDFPELWNKFVTEYVDLYNNFLDYHMKAADAHNVPTYYFRFEDLITDPYPVLKELFEFLYGVENIEGTYLDQRIKKVLFKGAQAYVPRKGGINKNQDQYSEEQLALIKDKNERMLKYFGYASIKGAEESKDHSTVVEYDPKDGDEFKLSEWKNSNKDHMDWVINKAEEVSKIEVNAKKLFPEETHVGQYFSKETAYLCWNADSKVTIKRNK